MNKDIPTNYEIRSRRAILVGEKGEVTGQFMTSDLIIQAEEKGVDLVQVGLRDRVPVCKIMDYKKFLYESKKRKKERDKGAKKTKIKEIKLRAVTERNDLISKVNQAKRFISKGYKVKVMVKFRGREAAHKKLVFNRCSEFYDLSKDFALMESPPRLSGKSVFMMLSSVNS